ETLEGHDVVISFLPGEAFRNYIPILIQTKIPVICGSTGMNWPLNFDSLLKENSIKWIYATNFSLGMNLVQQMIVVLSKARNIFDNYQFSLKETHHTKKLDAPSGTALSWKSWAAHEMNITSERIGDVTGIHELILTTPYEEITLKHNALDRKIFAEGALYAAKKITTDKTLAHGLHLFQDIVQQELKI
ncbi:MAG: dihydrodipicolinate reductase C-terminal domain-containing protein, partial [Bacteriovorax sp.]|nr:dihydrodipicolinate reductase C-terminal domain-containing protein [Bacteriovorax sp.]